MKKFILLIILLLNFVSVQSSAFSAEQNIYVTAYLVRLQNKVKANWEAPYAQSDKKAVVSVEVDKSGKILSSNLTEVSGDKDFDALALSAVSKTTSFEQFPSTIGGNNMRINLAFNKNSIEASQAGSVLRANNQVPRVAENVLPDPNVKDVASKTSAVMQDDSDDDDNAKDINFRPYMRNLQRQIKRNWHPPKRSQSKRVVTYFTVAKDGTLSNLKILKTSGSEKCDQRALDAIAKSVPLPPLPKEFSGKSIDIQFTFDYNVYGQDFRHEVLDDEGSYVNNDYKKMVEKIISHSLPKSFVFRDKCLAMRLNIKRDGSLDSVKVIYSSKDKKFDSRYVSAMKKISFPPFPESMEAQNLSLDYVVQVKKAESLDRNVTNANYWLLLSLILSNALCH